VGTEHQLFLFYNVRDDLQAVVDSLRTRLSRDLRPLGMGYQCPETGLGRDADYLAPTAMTCWSPGLDTSCVINGAAVCMSP
jgi:hypothetical protein